MEQLIKEQAKKQEETVNKTIHLTCDCGAHILQINSYLKYHDNNTLYYQEWDIALFDYAGLGKPTLWHRIKVAWKYLCKGTMHNDQIVLNNEEADKLNKFIRSNNFAGCIF